MTLDTYLQEKKELTIQTLASFLTHKKNMSPIFASHQTQIFNDLLTSTKNGKCLRSALIHIGYELFTTVPNADLPIFSAATELLQNGLLIHDDIMDNDTLRRGIPTTHRQWEERLKHTVNNPQKTGESIGICIGDTAFFLASELLSTTNQLATILPILYDEYQKITLAQMQDVIYGDANTMPSIKDIEQLYTYKTGRYSVALPLVIGAMLANQQSATIEKLWIIGEQIGLLYQIKDDELGLIGDETKTGKSVGSDIREGKKTIAIAMIYEKATEKEKQNVLSILKKTNNTKDEIEYIISLYTSYNIGSSLKKRTEEMIQNIHTRSDELQADPSVTDLLKQFTLFIVRRDK